MTGTGVVPQFSIKYLFLGMLVAAILLGFVAREPLGVGLAASFCVCSWLVMLVHCSYSVGHLVDILLTSIRQKQIVGLTTRYRWAILDGFIAVLLFFTIAISNFVMENSIANARYLIWCGWTAWLIGLAAIVGKVVLQRSNGKIG